MYKEKKLIKSCKLFQCHTCGVHAKAYSEIRAKGDESRILIQLLQVLPKKTEVIEIMGDILTDTEIIETLFCGKCGSPGTWTDIPIDLLECLGMIEPLDENGDKKDISDEKDISRDEENIELTKSKKKRINLQK